MLWVWSIKFQIASTLNDLNNRTHMRPHKNTCVMRKNVKCLHSVWHQVTCLVSFPGWSQSTACPARLNQQTSIEEREFRVILASSSTPLKTNTEQRERSIFLVLWYFDLIYCALLDGNLFCYQRSNATQWWNKRQKFLLPKNFSLHRGEEQGYHTRSSGAIFFRRFLVKVSATDFSFSFESWLVSYPLITAVILPSKL